MERQRDEEKLIPTIDLSFKPGSVHLALIKEAKQKNGIYSRAEALSAIRENPNADEKLKQQMVRWNLIHINELVEAGYFRQIGSDKWELVAELNVQKEFTLGNNHIKLLKKNTDGILRGADLKAPWRGLHTRAAERERRLIDGMLRNLARNNYIEKIGSGEYRLLEKAYHSLNSFSRTPGQRAKKNMESDVLKVTGFDKYVLEDCLTDGKLDFKKIQGHTRRSSIEKRIETLERAGYLVDGRPTDEYLFSFERVRQFSRLELTLDVLTNEQIQLVKDMRIFLNLSLSQIIEHIYFGDAQKARIDLSYLCKYKVLKRDEDTGIFIFGTKGISLSDELYPDAVRYKTKLLSRKEEVEHDMLVYSAYKEFEKKLIKNGGTILEIKNDRQLRSDYAKEHGYMQNGFPDLRVFYREHNSFFNQFHDIEIDCGYDLKTIISKISGITENQAQLLRNTGSTHGSSNGNENRSTGSRQANGYVTNGSFSWVCKTTYQTAKVASFLTTDRCRRICKHRMIDLYYMDKSGTLRRVIAGVNKRE